MQPFPPDLPGLCARPLTAAKPVLPNSHGDTGGTQTQRFSGARKITTVPARRPERSLDTAAVALEGLRISKTRPPRATLLYCISLGNLPVNFETQAGIVIEI